MKGIRSLVAVIATTATVACGGGGDEQTQATSASTVTAASTVATTPASSSAVATPEVELDTGRPQLVALDAADGRLRWTQEVSPFTFGLGIADGYVVEAGSRGQCEPAARVRGIDAGTGEIVWSVDYAQPGLAMPPSIAVADGVVVFTDTSGLVAVGASDGVEQWRTAVPPGPLTAGNGLVVVGSELHPSEVSPRVEAFHLADGTPAWRATGLPPQQVLRVLWAGDVVLVEGFTGFVGDQASVGTPALDGASGVPHWTLPGWLHAATGDLAIAQGSGAGGQPTSGTARSTLVGFSTADGEERWQAVGDMVSLSDAGLITVLLGPPPTQPPADGSFPMPLMSVTGRDPIDGSELWTADVQSATVINDLAILHTDQTLEAVGVADGRPRWRIPWPADALTPLLGSVSTGDDSVIVIWLPGTDRDAQPTGCD